MQDLILMQRWFVITGFLYLMVNGLYYKNKIMYFPLVSIYDIILEYKFRKWVAKCLKAKMGKLVLVG